MRSRFLHVDCFKHHHPSIFEGLKVITCLLTRSESLNDSPVPGKTLVNESFKQLSIDASMNQASQNTSLAPGPSSPLSDMLPIHLQRLLHASPPCATCYHLTHDPHHRSDGIPARFLHKLGMEMHAKRYPAGIKHKTVLVVKCEGIPASIIKHWSRRLGQWSEGWYAWKGGETWEDTPSIRRIAAIETDPTRQCSRPSVFKSSETQRGKPR